MKTKAVFAGLIISSLALAPTAWSHEGEEHGTVTHNRAKPEKVTPKPYDYGKPAAESKKMAKKGAKMNKSKADKKAVAKEHWVCPMHDGGESDHAGKCPKCGMDLVKEEAATTKEK